MSDINEMNAGMRWYVAHTYSGYENKVKANLEKIVENRGMQDLITDVRIPVEMISEGEGDEAKQVESKLLPSYVLVRMIMCDESWHVVRNIRGVTGFVGPGSKPVPLTEEEVQLYKRGRNAHTGHLPKNANRAQYQAATGLETLFGFLYLAGRDDRLRELFAYLVQNETTAATESRP